MHNTSQLLEFFSLNTECKYDDCIERVHLVILCFYLSSTLIYIHWHKQVGLVSSPTHSIYFHSSFNMHVETCVWVTIQKFLTGTHSVLLSDVKSFPWNKLQAKRNSQLNVPLIWSKSNITFFPCERELFNVDFILALMFRSAIM